MLPRERVEKALRFESPDVPPVEYHPSPAGLYEHGERLRDLWVAYPQDFGPPHEDPIPSPPEDAFDRDGRYHEFKTDQWGAVWEQRIFGVWGHPVKRPLDDWGNLDFYAPPPVPPASGPAFEELKATEAEIGGVFYRKRGWIDTIEVIRAVRRFEDTLMDMADNTPQFNRLADLIVDRQIAMVRYLVAAGADAIQLADDWGCSGSMMIAPEMWRAQFLHRYERLMRPVLDAGGRGFFHVCGWVWPILDDFADLGISAIWPQLTAYDVGELAEKCRDLGLAVAVHPDRGHLMQRGTPDQVRAEVDRLAEVFEIHKGGAWFYIEIDPNFPWANVEALYKAVAELRGRV